MDKINKFFNKYYGVDISNIDITMCTMDEVGIHVPGTNSICISNTLEGFKREMVIVHEITHVLQELNISISIRGGLLHVLDKNTIEIEEGIDELNRSIEIDARLSECLFVYEEYGYAGLDLVVEHVYRCGLTGTLMQLVSNINVIEYKNVLEKNYHRAMYVDKYTAIGIA